MTRPFVLVTDRLQLRDFVESDLEAIHELRSDPESVRYRREEVETLEQTREWLRATMAYNAEVPRVSYNLAIVLTETSELVGHIGIGRPSEAEPGEYDFGYVLNRRFWGRGYTTEALRALLAFTFRDLHAHRVFAHCRPANVASARVMEKVGMRREAYFKERYWTKGEWRDSLEYAILDWEWREKHSG